MAARKTVRKAEPVEVIPPRPSEPVGEQVDMAKRLEQLVKEQAKSQEKAST